MNRVRAILTIIQHDVRGIWRDRVALTTLALSILGTLAITILGHFHDRLPGWSAWFPFIVAMSLVGGPGGFAFLFGLLMIEEGETGARRALAVTPVPPPTFLLTRTAVVTAWMGVWPLASVYLMNWTWQVIDLPIAHWIAIVAPLALFTPALALVIPTLADDKVGALAVFKGLSFIMLLPLALYIIPRGAWYRPVFLLSPAGWVVQTFQAFLDHPPYSAYWWAVGGVTYAIGLLAAVVYVFRSKVYELGY
jgi:hypothetical protein